ncbi:hypothetical protein BDZ94DRAFT_1257879, partial [Collybia nuda]
MTARGSWQIPSLPTDAAFQGQTSAENPAGILASFAYIHEKIGFRGPINNGMHAHDEYDIRYQDNPIYTALSTLEFRLASGTSYHIIWPPPPAVPNYLRGRRPRKLFMLSFLFCFYSLRFLLETSNL